MAKDFGENMHLNSLLLTQNREQRIFQPCVSSICVIQYRQVAVLVHLLASELVV
jgi:hypothetical protein